MAQEKGRWQGKIVEKTGIFIRVKGVSGGGRAENQAFVPDLGVGTDNLFENSQENQYF
jgi:hypothetical protein